MPILILLGTGGTGLPAASGSYALTGSAAGFLTSTSGTGYVVTGFSATFTIAASAFDAQAGSYAVSGTAAALETGLTADVGNYTLTGTAATGAQKQGALAGAYTLTGADASFIYAVVNGYNLTGSSAMFRIATVAAASSYSLTGSSAAFSFVQPPQVGLYAITGVDAGFVVIASSGNYVLSCASGAYTLTGADATFPGLEPVTPPVVEPPAAGGAGSGAGARRRYGRYGKFRLKKKYRDELEELFDYIQKLPPSAPAEAAPPLTGKTAVTSLLLQPPSPSVTSLLDGVAAPVLTKLQRAVDDEDDDEVALLLELLS